MKYKLFLVEDEIGIRDRMKNSINWDETDFVYSGDAGDGELALPMILQQQPDVLITDIKMPFMDGLALSRAVKNCMPDIKIIIISGYEEFEFAKTAISIGVCDYLLKPVTPKKLLEVLAKVAREIHLAHDTSQYISSLRNQLDRTRPMRINKFLFDLVLGEMELPVIYEEAEKLCINVVAPFYNIAVIYCDSEQIGTEILEKSVDLFDCKIFQRSLNEYCILLLGETEDKLMLICNQLCGDLEHYLGGSRKFYLGLGTPVSRLTEIPQSYKQACYCISFKDLLHIQGSIIRYNECENLKTEKNINNILSPDNKQELMSFLKTGLSSDTREFLKKYIMKLDISKISMQQEKILWLGIYETIREFLVSIDCDPATIEAVVPDAANKSDQEEYCDVMQELLLDALKLRDIKRNNRFNNIIAKTKNYIEENYDKADLLNSIAKSVYISAGYLNTIFKKELGVTVPEYISAVRIKKAKEFLRTTNLQISVISEKTGYQDPNYFSTAFKKQTGMTPNEYRKK